jgi:nucleoside-diphosphate-sugar epimerase
MRVVVAGGHGQIARRLGRLLAARGDEVVGLVRQTSHLDDLAADGSSALLLDLEDASVDDVAAALERADAVVFAAGAGPGSGIPRKDTVDRAASVLLADAAERAGVARFLQISSMGVDQVRTGAVPSGRDEVFVAYLQAKAAAEDDLRRRSGLRWTILRPGALTDDPGTGQVTLAPQVPRGAVPRDDVAAVLVALLDEPGTSGLVLEVVSGATAVVDAVEQVASRGER